MTRIPLIAILLCCAAPVAAHPGLEPHGLIHQVLHVVEANLPIVALFVVVAAFAVVAGRRGGADRGRNSD